MTPEQNRKMWALYIVGALLVAGALWQFHSKKAAVWLTVGVALSFVLVTIGRTLFLRSEDA